MRIDKISENQIRCTLTKDDLAERKIKISELAYGSDKAKSLFRDMMQKASFEYGFEAEDIPLVIEAIPVSSECIVLIITKVEDPEELDTRFSKFAPSVQDVSGNSISDLIDNLSEGADEVLDLFKKLQSVQNNVRENEVQSNSNPGSYEEMSEEDAKAAARAAFKSDIRKRLEEAADTMAMVRIYAFDSLDIIIKLSKLIKDIYNGNNSLFKDIDGEYLLSISKSDLSPADFNRVCNILAEYGTCIKSVSGSEAYLAEHYEPIIFGNALATLAEL